MSFDLPCKYQSVNVKLNFSFFFLANMQKLQQTLQIQTEFIKNKTGQERLPESFTASSASIIISETFLAVVVTFQALLLI